MIRPLPIYLRVCLQGFFFWLAYDLSRFPVIPLYAQKLGLGPEAVGFAVAASTITGIFGKSLSGGLSDSVGRKIMMIVACVIAVVLPCLYFLATSATSLVTLRLFHGLGTAIMGPVGRALISDIVPAEVRGNRLSTYTASANLGTMAARSASGFLLFWGGFFYPFAASALAALVTLGLAFRFPADRRHPLELRPIVSRMIVGFREVVANGAILGTSVIEAVQYLVIGVIDAFLPLYAKEHANLEDWQVGLLYGFQMLTIILLKPVMGSVSDRFGRRPQIIIGLVCGSLIVWRIPWTTTFPPLVLLVVLYGIAISMTASATSAYITDLCERRHYGAAHGVFGTIQDIGHAAGPITAGLVIGAWGYRAGFSLYSFVLIFASLLFGLLVKERS